MFGVCMIPMQRQESGVQWRTGNCGSKITLSHSQCVLSPLSQPRAIQKHGNNWAAVANMVQRLPADCSDWFHQYVQYQNNTRRGMSPDEHSIGIADAALSRSMVFRGRRSTSACNSQVNVAG